MSSSPEPFASRWPRFLRHDVCFRLFDRLRDAWRDRDERRRFAARTLPATARRVLLVRDRGLGDVLQITSLFEAIRARYNVERLGVMTSGSGAEILRSDPLVDEALRTSDSPPDIAERYDLFINFHIYDNSPGAREAVLRLPEDRLLGRTFRPGRDESWLEHTAGGTWLRKYCRIADIPYADDLPLRLRIVRDAAWKAERARLADDLRRARRVDRPFRPLALCVGGADWRRNYSAAFLDRLLAVLEPAYDVLLVGMRRDVPESERTALDASLARFPGAIDRRDDLLRTLLLSLDLAGALVTCDTGPLHMALGLGTPAVALFGHTTGRQLLGPARRTERLAVLTPPFRCRACADRVRPGCLEERRALCMDAFDPEEVRRTADALYAEKTPEGTS